MVYEVGRPHLRFQGILHLVLYTTFTIILVNYTSIIIIVL